MYDAISLHSDDRRNAPRLPLRTYMNQYVRDEPYQALALDVSESGLAIRKPTARIPHTRVVGLELELPGTGEVIWASAEPRFHSVNAQTHFSGLHFLGMATRHERLIRDYVRERRERLQRLLTPRPIYISRFGCRFS
jgi:c-di-GMP-binding flagellar brake protein YcgR